MLLKTAALALLASGAAAQSCSGSAYTCVNSGVSASYTICFNGGLITMSCGAGTACYQSGASVYCDFPGKGVTTTAAASTTTTTTTKSSTTKSSTTKPTTTKPTTTTTTTTTPSKTTTTTATSTSTSTFVPRPAPNANGGNVGVVGYWPDWAIYTRSQNNPNTINVSKVTVLNYAFFGVKSDGTLYSYDPWADFGGSSATAPWAIDPYSGQNKGIANFMAARAANPNLRTVLSIGGWSLSGTFSDVAANQAATDKFVSQVVAFLDQFWFDGLDLDWEYPGGGGLPCNHVSPNDAANFVNLLAALRKALGPNRILSIAASAEPSRYTANGVNYLTQYAKYLSYFQIMTYDFYGSWVPYTDFNSPLQLPGASDPQRPAGNIQFGNVQFSIATAMANFAAAGVPKNQLVGGVAFYGRSWGITPADAALNSGLFQPCNKAGQDKTNPTACPPIQGDQLDTLWSDPCGGSYVSGVWMYTNLRSQGVLSTPTTAGSGWTRTWWNFAQSPTITDGSRFIAYDDTTSIAAKTAWLKSNGYSGTMFWELSEDYKGELLSSLTSAWGK
ncbi:glycosyl hydrolases family 18-domain-containing protein [Polychytrium aggregatum]|uniref:glycosyl hydrolases family 18-domain-containing protein n=1 Tax=Polychytrium aggregatum TaxID=110093 RepID=UPI0022FE27A6|nr:glycosyl hydrolases family 18-domain-containing protein [Polychytrium aggregatum]KAI9205373.1 glycosyl hydrolases family 18-domain-containing protein [Polychytrium aggregatum]